MIDMSRYAQEQLSRIMERLFCALMDPETRELESELSLDALAFATAVILDMNPGVALPAQLRKAAEQHGPMVFAYLKWLRQHFNEKGVRFGTMIGGKTPLTDDLPPRFTRH